MSARTTLRLFVLSSAVVAGASLPAVHGLRAEPSRPAAATTLPFQDPHRPMNARIDLRQRATVRVRGEDIPPRRLDRETRAIDFDDHAGVDLVDETKEFGEAIGATGRHDVYLVFHGSFRISTFAVD
jgi:hypothetical protein